MEKTKSSVNSGDKNDKSSPRSHNDSLEDFKSPKAEPVAQTSSKLKLVTEKRAKNSSSRSKASASSKKKQGSTSGRQLPNGTATQVSIESSFFKASNTGKPDGKTCPLCMRYFEDAQAGAAHTKSCAAKNNVSTTKLLAAVALQERQADERLAIGLPAGPVLQTKDKNPRRNRAAVSKNDPDLQLALALSKSLHDNQVEQELDEAWALAAKHSGDAPIAAISDSQRRSTLKNFGFLTNKPATDVPIKPRRKKHLGPTILQTRTQESRDRLWTERIAEILMGNEAITQVGQRASTAEVNIAKQRPIVLKSRLLNEIHRTTKRLWDRAQLSKTVTDFYVEDLGDVVVPTVESQQEDIAAVSEANTVSKETNSPRLLNEATSNKEPDKMLHLPNDRKRENEDRAESLKNVYVADRQYRNTLILDWANTLNVSSMSDVVVLVENAKHIWAHKLVFHVRCSDILLDCQPINDAKFPHVREKICWPDIDYLTALAFLEFVYSGVIEKYEHIVNDERTAGLLRSLARKYRLKVLFEYMRKRKCETDRRSEELEGRRSGLKSPIIVEVARRNRKTNSVLPDKPTESNEVSGPSTPSPRSKSGNGDFPIAKTPNTEVQSIEDERETINLEQVDSEQVDNISLASTHRCCSMSPDLFDDTTEEAMQDTAPNSPQTAESSAQISTNENSNLKELAQLIAEDDISPPAEAANRSDASSTASTYVEDEQSKDRPIVVEKTEEYSSLAQNQAETPKSRGVSISRETKNNNSRSRTQRLREKQRSNISIFIEKVQRINAKSALDSYTEDDTLGDEPINRERLRNPFNVNNESNKSISDDNNAGNTESGQCMIAKGALSAFEEQLLLQHEKNENHIDLTFADETAIANEASSIVASDLEDSSVVDNTTDEENMSMYSRYKKSHKQNSSINKHRSLLMKLTAAAASADDDKSDDLNDEAIDLTQETDSEVESSPSSNIGRPIRRRSSTRAIISDSNESQLSGERRGAKEKTSTVRTVHDLSRVSSDDGADESFDTAKSATPPLDRAIDEDKSSNIASSAESSFSRKKNLSTSFEYPDPHQYDEDAELIFTQSLKIRRTLTPSPRNSAVPNESLSGKRKRRFDESKARENVSAKGAKSFSNSAQYPDLDLFEVDENVFTQSFTSPRHSPHRSLTPSPKSESGSPLRKRRTDESKQEKDTSFADEAAEEAAKNPIGSPHCSDLDVFEVDDDFFAESFKSPSQEPVSPRRTFPPLPTYEEYHKNDSDKNESLRVRSPIIISSSPDMDVVDTDNRVKNTEDSNKENSCLGTKSNVSPLYSRRNTLSPSNFDEPSSPKPGPSRRRLSPECGKGSSSSAKSPLVRWNSMPTGTSSAQNNLKRNRTPTKSSRQVLSQSATPPVNYDAMDTPELKRELDKYGIKPQKAHRARQLLTHIYNELHSEIPTAPSTASDVASSEDEEPPAKKIGRSNSHASDDSEAESVTSAVSVIAEEMEFADSDTQSNNSDDVSSKSSIKQAFTALLRHDKELHNKVLTYEPLPLELLHLMLKARGFKCNVNDLRDFLDQECITFRVQNQQRRRKTRKARGAKTAATKAANGVRKPNTQKS